MAKQKSSIIRLHTLAVIAASVILIAVAFLAGLLVAMRGAEQLSTIEDDSSDDSAAAIDDTDAVEGVISVDWYATDAQEEREGNFYVRQWWEEKNGVNEASVYSATVMGEVSGGEYNDQYFVRESVTTGMEIGGESVVSMYVLEQQQSDVNPTVLTKYAVSSAWGPYLDSVPVSVFTTVIGNLTFTNDAVSGMDLPGLIASDPSGAPSFVEIGVGHIADAGLAAAQYPDVVHAAEGIDLYPYTSITRPEGFVEAISNGVDNEFFAILPDGRTVWYTIVMNGWESNGHNVQVPGITWNDGSTVGEYYRGFIGGCGFQALTHVVDETPKLLASGETVDGVRTVFTPEDYSNALLATDYQNWKNMQNQLSETADTSVAAFAKGYPVFYMQDVLNRWVQFTRSDVVPAGECGKPVIYLYPTTTTNIDVSLAPQGGFTKTEPAYGNGWHVTAQPDGTLTNLADGLTYPYLFWEGRGGMYSAPQKYWVVAKADVPLFLTSTLAKLGLNAKESADFMEFWLPRMTAAPYYKIGFHGTNVMNAIAPMTLSQKADTLLRVLMDYSELAAPIAANPPTLSATPVRNGFTVIEWGGVIR